MNSHGFKRRIKQLQKEIDCQKALMLKRCPNIVLTVTRVLQQFKRADYMYMYRTRSRVWPRLFWNAAFSVIKSVQCWVAAAAVALVRTGQRWQCTLTALFKQCFCTLLVAFSLFVVSATLYSYRLMLHICSRSKPVRACANESACVRTCVLNLSPFLIFDSKIQKRQT